MSATWLSVVIPAFNEAGRLGPTLQRVREYAAAAGRPCEAVVVDDGSTDGTAELVRAFAAESACGVSAEPIRAVAGAPLAVQLLVSPANRGKGHAVRQGMLAATGELLLISDADLSAPIEEVANLLPWLERGYDVVIGSRDLPESRLDPPQPPVRRWLAGVFRALRRRLMLPGLRDTQCGFKLLRREAGREVFAHVSLEGWLFDCEMLGIADRLGYRIKEVGVVWRHHPHTRVNHWREGLTAVPTLLAIRRRVRNM